MSIKEDYYVRQITYSEAMDIVTQHHYLHRKSSCSFAFGLFKSNNGQLINADVNSAYQIGKKVFPEIMYGIEGGLTPVIINVVKTT